MKEVVPAQRTTALITAPIGYSITPVKCLPRSFTCVRPQRVNGRKISVVLPGLSSKGRTAITTRFQVRRRSGHVDRAES
jgi:hypothetical protein